MHIHTEEMRDKQKTFDWLCQLAEQYETSFVITDPDLPDHPLVYVNDAFLEMTGYAREELIGKNCRLLQGKWTNRETVKSLHEADSQGYKYATTILNYKKDGTSFWNDLKIYPVHDQDENVLFFIGLQTDVTPLKRAETLLSIQEEMYQNIDTGLQLYSSLQKMCDLIEEYFFYETKCSIMLVDDEDRLHVAAADSLPPTYTKHIENLKIGPNVGSCGTATYFRKPIIVEHIQTSPLWKNYWNVVPDELQACWSIPILTEDGAVLGTFGMYFSQPRTPGDEELEFLQKLASLIYLAIKHSNLKSDLNKLAYVDHDSNLPNRHAFASEVEKLNAMKEEGFVAILEPTEFSHIVDIYGRHAGDELLKILATRIRRVMQSRQDFIARFSSHSLVLTGTMPFEEIELYMGRLLTIANEPFAIGEAELFITLKIGVTPFKAGSVETQELIRFADTALSSAKRKSGSAFTFFETKQDMRFKEELMIFNQLSRALSHNEFTVHLQPKVKMETGEIYAFESLARWYSPILGNVPPDVFISAAETSGKIRLIEKYLTHQLLTWMSDRQKAGKKLLKVSINVSADHFFHPYFVLDLKEALRVHQIDTSLIRVEITESIGMVDFEKAKLVFHKLKEAGIESSVDDFGKGYSSLSYLRQFPVREIKIDRSFVQDLGNEGTRAIVTTIVQLAQNLKMESTAEGIETKEQLDMLQEMGCFQAQGYYFYKPMPLEEIDRLLEE